MTPTVFIPALLCDDALYAGVIAALGSRIEPHVLMSPHPVMDESVADILARAPARFALVGTSYGGNLAMAVALAAPERVSALWLMGCNPAAPTPGGPDLAGSLDAAPDAVIGMLVGLVVHKDHAEAAEAFRVMARRVGGSAGAAQARALASRAEMKSRLASLHMPALVLWGEDDTLVPVAVGHGLAEGLPHAHLHVLPNCGHLPTMERPAAAAVLFAEFLDGEGM